MPFVRMMRMLSAMESGPLSGAALEALLQEPGRLGELQVLTADRALLKRMQSSNTTMQAVAGSTLAMPLVLDASDPDYLLTKQAGVLLASAIASQKMAAETRWRKAVINSHAALSHLVASPAGLNAFRSTASAFTVRQYSNSGGALVNLSGLAGSGAKYLVLGASTESSAAFNVELRPYKAGVPIGLISISAATGQDGVSGAGPMAMVIGGESAVPQFMRTSAENAYFSLRLLRCDI